MAVWLEKLGVFARSPDARPLAEIGADIDAELAFHVEESARDLCAEGLDAESARAEALRRFGDFGRIRRECARTQMGERVMLQRIQIVLTAVLIAAVGLLLWSNHDARAAMVAERQQNAALLARIDARFSTQSPERGLLRNSVSDRMPTDPIAAIDRGPSAEVAEQTADAALYLGADGRRLELGEANDSWCRAFLEQGTSWRHGLRMAERLAALPGVQGAEILAQIWSRLPVQHREQAMKPFVFDGGLPTALEVLALGIRDVVPSVRERAGLYLQTYAFRDLLVGEGTAEAWLAQWGDRPVDEVLRANAARWASELGTLGTEYELIPLGESRALLAVAGQIRPKSFERAGLDLPAILEAGGVCALKLESLGLLDSEARSDAKKILALCPSR
jgi:hypothetical protein